MDQPSREKGVVLVGTKPTCFVSAVPPLGLSEDFPPSLEKSIYTDIINLIQFTYTAI